MTCRLCSKAAGKEEVSLWVDTAEGMMLTAVRKQTPREEGSEATHTLQREASSPRGTTLI